MKVKVVRDFRDKYTLVIHRRGDVLEITEERYAELKLAGEYVYNIAQDGAEKAPETAADGPADGFDDMSIRELKEYADKAYKLTFKVGMKKAEIIDKLRRMEQASK